MVAAGKALSASSTSAVIGEQPKEETIEDMFRELENGDFQFDYTKPKKIKKQCEVYDFE